MVWAKSKERKGGKNMPEFAQRQHRTQAIRLVNPAKPDRAIPHPIHAENLLLACQQALGNQAVQSFAQPCHVFPNRCPFGGVCHTCPARVQAKLTINEPGDKYEQAADRIAEQVMRMPGPIAPSKAAVSWRGHGTRINWICPECEEELQRKPVEEEEKLEELIQIKEGPGPASEVTPGTESCIRDLKGGGCPLPDSARGYFEPRFGQDFSPVRIHTDAVADESACGISALAYTVGHDIVFAAGQYAPETTAGRQLLAHELTHVVQQEATGSVAVQCQTPESGTVSSSTPITVEAAMQLGEQALVARIAATKAELAAAESEDVGRLQQELTNLKEALKNVCVTQSGVLSSITEVDLLYTLTADGISVAPASNAISAMEDVDAESIVSCANTELLVLEQAFAGAGAPFLGAVQVAREGTDEYKGLEAYRNNNYDTLRQIVKDLLPAEEFVDPLIGPHSGASGAAHASTVEIIERELDEKGIDTVEKIKGELQREINAQREAAGVPTAPVAEGESPAMAGAAVATMGREMLFVTAEGTAAPVSSGAVVGIGAVLFTVAVAAGVLIYCAFGPTAQQEAIRHGALRIRVLQQRLAELLAGTAAAVSTEEMISSLESAGIKKAFMAAATGPGNFEDCFWYFARCLAEHGFSPLLLGTPVLDLSVEMANVWNSCVTYYFQCMYRKLGKIEGSKPPWRR